MAGDRFELETLIPATPADVYRAWLDGREHTRMTGGSATGSPEVGALYTAWDGYIRGKNLELEPEARILQTWRSSEFPEDAPDSLLEVLLFEDGDGTRLVLRHSEVPAGQVKSYEDGWVEHYFEPMKKHFGRGGKKAPAPKRKKPAAKAKAKRAAPRKAAAQVAKKAKTARKAKAKAPKKRPARRGRR